MNTNFELEDDEKPPLKIKIKTLLGKEVKYSVRPNETIKRLKTMIEKAFDISPRQQCLVYEDTILEEGIIKDFNLENGSVINLILK